MRRHETGANDRLAVTDRRIDGRGGENPLLVETLRKGEGLCLTADQDGDDRGLRGADLEPDRLEPLMHLAGVSPEHLDPLRFLLHNFQGLENAPDDSGCQGGCEDETTGLVLHELDHLLGTGDEAPHGAKRLGESTHHDVDIVVDPEMMNNTSSLRANYT